MYFKIDENKRVVMTVHGKAAESLEADNVTSFKVENEPIVETNEILFYDSKIGAFFTEKMSEPTEEMKAKAQARAEAVKQRANALKWLADNDWKVNKHLLGEWADDDDRWLAYLDGRAKARSDYDAAEAVLNG